MSLSLLAEHRRIWADKPVLRQVYSLWFERILRATQDARRVVEVGAGPGFLAEYARRQRPGCLWIATDLLSTGWNDVVADALRMPFRAASADAVVGLDVLHHLAEPRRFFEETARILATGGTLALVEPWVTPLSYPIYRWLHREGCDLKLDPWRPFGDAQGGKAAFDGNAAVPWRILRTSSPSVWEGLGFEQPVLAPINGFSYLLSLGFTRRSLLPAWLFGASSLADEVLRPAASWLGMRIAIVWRRAAPSAPAH